METKNAIEYIYSIMYIFMNYRTKGKMNMRRMRKIVSVTLLIICFTSTLFGCTNSNEVTDNNETTTVTDNETKETTTKEPETEEPTTTEEPSTEYAYKGKKVELFEESIIIEKIDDLTLEKGSKIYINDICKNDIEFADVRRGSVVSLLLVYLYKESNVDTILEFEEKYCPDGAPRPSVTYEDNYCIEYIHDNTVTFHYIETIDGYACFDLY